MKSQCPYTGLIHETHAFRGLNTIQPHPIFSVPNDSLLVRAALWSAPGVSVTEKQLLFVALLQRCEMIIFRPPAVAQPSEQLINNNMERLIKLAHWKLYRVNDMIPNFTKRGYTSRFPTYTVDLATQSLSNLPVFLQQWEELKEDEYSDYIYRANNRSTSEERSTLAVTEDALARLIKSAAYRTASTHRALGQWCLKTMPRVDSDTAEYWQSLFEVKHPAIYKIREVDFHELLDHMERYLHHGSIYAAEALKHIRTQIKINKEGDKALLGLEDVSIESNTPYIEMLNSNHAIAPVNEPKRHEFKSDMLFYKAKSAWNIEQERLRLIEAERRSQYTLITERANNSDISASLLAEDAEDDAMLEIEEQFHVSELLDGTDETEGDSE